MKTCSQPIETTSHPISGVNTTVAKYCAELKMAAAKPRSLVGNQAATIFELPGNDGPSKRPTSRRSRNSNPTAVAALKLPIAPCAMVNADHSTIAQPYTFFAPNRSSRYPDGICEIRYVQPNAENR